MRDPRAGTSPTPASYNINDLAIWRTKLPKVQHALLPASNNRPNPAVSDERLFVSVLSPGAVCALQRRTGRILWRRAIPGLCGDAVFLHKENVFARSSNILYRLCAKTGEPLWSFCPQGTDRETIYSSPVIQGDRLFIGDRAGFLNCLDTLSGKLKWRQLTNDSKHNVNSTPIVVKNLVIAATNARTAVAYTVEGKLKWRTKLDGPSALGLFEYRGKVGVAGDSLYLLNAVTGRIRKRFHWKGGHVSQVDKSREEIVVQLRGCWPPVGGSHVMVVNCSREIQRSYRLGFCLAFRYARETDLMFESHLDGINAFRTRNPKTLFEIRLKGPHGIGLVAVRDKIIYATTGDGYVYALRHPPMK